MLWFLDLEGEGQRTPEHATHRKASVLRNSGGAQPLPRLQGRCGGSVPPQGKSGSHARATSVTFLLPGVSGPQQVCHGAGPARHPIYPLFWSPLGSEDTTDNSYSPSPMTDRSSINLDLGKAGDRQQELQEETWNVGFVAVAGFWFFFSFCLF